ncbi:helix-turn-helix domain-containing protein [Kitasatospora sp. NPDC088391]|uniref:helix-turn-helix domain-containing protein n=1 Tax=Kitasatospora sp. NPDC088391 TaxID=3364074 RepID=UPI0038017B3E
MSASSSSSVQEARRALGQRLRDIRQDAGLSARELADRAGWHESKCSKLQSGRTTPTDTDLRTWTTICGVPKLAGDLIAALRGIEGAYVEWRRLERSGLKQSQQAVRPLFERTRRFRMYQSWVIPGLLQTAEYTRAVLNTVFALRGSGHDDVDEAVAVRMERQRVLRSGDHRFAFLIEEWVLRTVIGDAETLAAQLGHIIAVSALPSVSVGIIPMGTVRGAGWPTESFTIYDDVQVNVELVAAHLTATQPGEIAEYGQAFSALASIAVHGAEARALITSAINSLG